MERILPNRGRRALHGCSSTRLIESQALIAEVPHALMLRAGTAVARLLRALYPHAQTLWVAAGPGNNGGDGLVAARLLRQQGWTVTVTLAADPLRLPDDARDALEQALAAGVPVTADTSAMHPPFRPDVAIDALLGVGASRSPTGALADLVDHLNALACPVLAIDVPSGLNADTGQPFGEACVKARHTLSLLTLKPGLFTGSGRDFAGTVWLDDLQANTSTVAADAWLSGESDAAWPTRAHAQHKGSFGDVAVVGGATGMVGAVLLAARAAHAAGAGRVYVSTLSSEAPLLDPLRPELMFRRDWQLGPVDTLRRATVVCGCGGGDAVRAALPVLLSHVPRLVLDADALNAVASDEALQRLLKARAVRQLNTVMTPHPLEAARLLGSNVANVQSDRLHAARQLAERFACVIVLKGSGSVIATPGELPSINSTGNAALATAGTGDVLAGWLGGHWAARGGSAQAAATHAVWLHGRAADVQPTAPLRAADLVDVMHRLMRQSLT